MVGGVFVFVNKNSKLHLPLCLMVLATMNEVKLQFPIPLMSSGVERSLRKPSTPIGIMAVDWSGFLVATSNGIVTVSIAN